MDFHRRNTEEPVEDAGSAGLPRGVFEELVDPIVQALMAADRIDQNRVEALMRCMAARLASRCDRLRNDRLEGSTEAGPRRRHDGGGPSHLVFLTSLIATSAGRDADNVA
jgi:hypothetical protein